MAAGGIDWSKKSCEPENEFLNQPKESEREEQILEMTREYQELIQFCEALSKKKYSKLQIQNYESKYLFIMRKEIIKHY